MASAARRCVSVGPFNDPAQQTRAAALLQERGFAPQQRTEDGDVHDGFWVYVGGIKSPADETRVLRTLQDAGISDAHAMAAADDGRRVSVGLFTERSRAERRARVVEHLGFSPDIVERRRPGTVYWVDLDLGTSDAAVPTEGLAPADQGGSRIQVRVCP
jgi:cell division septation protein DedD